MRRPTGWRADALALALFAVVACLLLWPVVLRGEVLLPAGYLRQFFPWAAELPKGAETPPWNALQADSILQYLPWRQFARESLRDGFLPLWNPHQLSGLPLVANYQSALFYPPNILFWLLPAARAFGISALLHLFLAGAFLYLYLRGRGLRRCAAVVGGLAFELCGALVCWLELPTAVNVLVWVPLALHLWERSGAGAGWRRGLPLVLPLAMILLAGHPQFAFYSLLAILAYAAAHAAPERGARAWLETMTAQVFLPLGLAALLAAPQVLPMLELSSLSHRGGGPLLGAGAGSFRLQALPFWAAVVLFLPDFFGSPARGDYWGPANYGEFVGYTGVLPLILAALALLTAVRAASSLPSGVRRRIFFFALLAGVAVLASFRNPLGELIHTVIPGLGRFGSPGRMLALFSLGTAALAGFGCQALLEARGDRRARPAVAVALVAVAGIALAVWAARGASALGAGATPQILLARAEEWLRFLALTTGAGALLWLALTRRMDSRWVAALLPALVAADLLAFGLGYNATAPASLAYPGAANRAEPTGQTIAFLRALGPQTRFLAVTPAWTLHQTPLCVLPPNAATAYCLYDVNGYDSLYPVRTKTFLNRVAGRETSPPTNGNMVLFDAYTAPDFPSLACGYVVTLEAIHAPGFTLVQDGVVKIYQAEHALPRAFVADTPEGAPRADARAALTAAGPTRVSVEVEVTRPGYLVLLDADYPGWRARVDGKPVAITAAREAFRAVPLETGARRVTFCYEPSAFRVGLFLALTALALIAGLGTFARIDSQAKKGRRCRNPANRRQIIGIG